MGKFSSKLYDIQRKIYKIASKLSDIEDLSKGRIDKVTKRHIKRSFIKEINKIIARFINRLF